MFKNLKEFAQKRSEFGSKKYRIDSPGPGPWGDDPTIELFWFRNLPEDMREELADAQVYSDRLAIRVDGVGLNPLSQAQFDGLMNMYQQMISTAYNVTVVINELLGSEAPQLLEDQEEMWGKHSPRLKFAE